MPSKPINSRLLCVLAAMALLSASACSVQSTRSGGFTSLQAERTQFTRMDRNSDGFITARELKPELRLAREFDSWDRDGDGRISYPEFNAYIGEVMG